MRCARRLAFAFALVLALVLGQQGALLHALGHATDQVGRQGDAPAPSTSCEQCALFAGLDAAMAPDHSAAPVQAASIDSSLAPAFGVRRTALSFFDSRAPPDPAA